MTVKILMGILAAFDKDTVVTVGDSSGGWTNIDCVVEDGSSIKILMDEKPIFSGE